MVYKSSGAGGQNVQKNATAVRLTHIPTGLVVTCQNERSQVQNRGKRASCSESTFAGDEKEEQAETISELRGEYTKAEWALKSDRMYSIRNQLVKDHRTDFENGNTQAVLDGDLDPFIEAFLRKVD